MKKAITFILLLTYGTAMAGTALQLHYCEGGWMTDFYMMQSANSSTHHNIVSCEKMVPRDCCQHPVVKIKISSDQLLPDIGVLKTFPVSLPFIHLSANRYFEDLFKSNPGLFDHSPPVRFTKANYRQAFYSVFLI